MKHITKSEAADFQYIAANNVLAFYLSGGEEGARAEIVSESAKIEQRSMEHGTCSICISAFVQWYERSCSIALKQMIAGEKLTDDYAPFNSPCWAGNN